MGIVSAVVAAQLLVAAAGRHVAPWARLPLPASPAGWSLLLTGAALALVVLIVVALLRGEQVVAISVGGDGAVLVPCAALDGLVEAVALEHVEVVRARARVRSHAGRLEPRLWVALRPLADSGAIAAQLAGQVTQTLASRTGLPLDRPVVEAQTLAVSHLRRYLT